MRRKIVLALAAVLAMVSNAQAAPSVWDGVYTDVQAERGGVQFQQHCARCHGANLAGTFETPPLVGRFIPYWAGTTLDALFDYVSTAMPLDRPVR
jgi:mono/diheme cytochrome c family protein